MLKGRDGKGKLHLIGETNPETERKRGKLEERARVDKLKRRGAGNMPDIPRRVVNDPKEG